MWFVSNRREFQIGVGVLLIIMFPFFFLGGPSVFSSSLFRALWDSGHLIFFFGFVFFVHKKYPISGWRYCLSLSLFVFVVGSLIEIIQSYTGRNASWFDILHNLLGAWIAMFWLQKSSLWTWLGRGITAAFLLPIVYHIVLTAWSQVHLMQQFPLLADFESSIDAHGWKGKVERTPLRFMQSQYALKIHFSTDRYSTISFSELYNSWKGYTFLSMDIYNPDVIPLAIKLRIHDSHHEKSNSFSDRFNKDIQLESGWNTISIPMESIQKAPATRELDLSSVVTLAIFTMRLPEPRDIYLDNVLIK
jgi:hypothetical protein